MHRALALLAIAWTTSVAAADVVVVDAVELDADDFAYGDFASTGLRTVQLWLAGLDDGDALLAVFGRPLIPLTIETSDPDGFYNGIELGQTHFAPAEALFPVFPELQWDTFVTIGRDPDTRVSPGFPDTALEGGGSSLLDAHVSWFDMAPATPAMEVDGRVLFGQFTFGAAYELNLEEMQINVHVVDAFGVERELWNVQVIPAPGVYGAFGVLTAVRLSRRRRASPATRR